MPSAPVRTILVVSLALAALSLLASPAVTQVGLSSYRDFSFPNTTGRGSAQLQARVFYPASASSYSAPLIARPGGYPVVVFLHGFGLLGSAYGLLGSELSSRGYVVVLSDTALTSGPRQVSDGLALYPALAAANAQTSHFLEGALDMGRAGLCGHSMGGGGIFGVLASNPGYVAGLAISPMFPGSAVMGAVDVPVGVVHGEGDVVNPWRVHGLPTYNAATSYERVKFFYRFNWLATHTNVAGFPVTPMGWQIWSRTVRVITGFFDRFLSQLPAGMEEVVGKTARGEPYLSSLQVEVEQPDLWSVPQASIGATSRVEVLGETGPAALFAAAGIASVATPFGVLRLEPATIVVVAQGAVGSARLFTSALAVPNDPSLVGAQVPFQGVGIDRAGRLRLSGLLIFEIGP